MKVDQQSMTKYLQLRPSSVFKRQRFEKKAVILDVHCGRTTD